MGKVIEFDPEQIRIDVIAGMLKGEPIDQYLALQKQWDFSDYILDQAYLKNMPTDRSWVPYLQPYIQRKQRQAR